MSALMQRSGIRQARSAVVLFRCSQDRQLSAKDRA
jgi:hypothetical protein